MPVRELRRAAGAGGAEGKRRLLPRGSGEGFGALELSLRRRVVSVDGWIEGGAGGEVYTHKVDKVCLTATIPPLSLLSRETRNQFKRECTSTSSRENVQTSKNITNIT